MNIHQISEETGISLRTLRRLEKFDCLIADPIDPVIERAMTNLRRGKRLTVEQLLHLVKAPNDMSLLMGFEAMAQHQIDQLGDVLGEKMPSKISSNAPLVASNDLEATDKLAAWFCDFINYNPAFAKGATRDHAFLAVRMLVDIPDHLLRFSLPSACQIMWRCRHAERMKGYWHSLPETKRTVYHRPVKFFDL